MKNTKQLGIIAGRGHYPFLILREARKNGVDKIAVAAIQGDASEDLEQESDAMAWVYPGQINRTIKFFQKQGITEAVMVGQVKPSRLFTGLKPDLRTLFMLGKLKERNADTLFSAVCNEFQKSGITILSAITYLDEHLAGEGLLNNVKADKSRLRDAEYAFSVAKEVSRMDIGQSVVVKRGTILAVEGFEGTDKAIIRGGELGRGGVTVCKVTKPDHDMRFDVPCIGMRTVDSLIQAKARTLVVEAKRTLFIEKERVLEALDRAKISVIGKNA
ncbi:hypothetical protein LNTAR_23869 [Lentisphaera araneosa HTCC2155]|uniref:DUF1009 domain-containing protein n=1 Tax=Lentisphaera araneosa HTCC2155 TaxID=313628 RepID=A6DU45_9BACT|nr:UDP-2,3-diacylglucosamine diphosphatase LpxI [Lentisphaera araneosa]EDM24841.1 hypothetical protein LNTAR_23869 [Lentisphaera araneosa HTCC2155]